MHRKTKAEQDAFYHRLAYRLERRMQEKKRTIARRVVDGGCVVLEPARWAIRNTTRLHLSN